MQARKLRSTLTSNSTLQTPIGYAAWVPWQRVPNQPRDEPPREVWVDDGGPLSRYDFLTILVRGYSDLGLKAPEAIRVEYQALVAAELARIEAAWDERLREQFNFKPKPFKFTDVTNG